MLHVTLRTSAGKELPISLPSQASEVPFNEYIDLSVGYGNLVAWIKEKEESGSLYVDRTYYIYRVAGLLSEYLGVDIIDLLKLPVTGLIDKQGNLYPEVLKEHLARIGNHNSEPVTVEQLNSSAGAVMTILEYIQAAILNYKPKFRDKSNYQFTHRGKTWNIPRANVLAYEQLDFPKITVLEAIECLEISRQAKSKKDVDGSHRYTNHLHKMAVLCRQPGEDIDIENFDNMIDVRMREFEGITMDIALDVVFFSLGILNTYVRDHVTNIFSKKPLTDRG